MLEYNNKIAELRKQYDEIHDKVFQLEHVLEEKADAVIGKNLEFSQIKM